MIQPSREQVAQALYDLLQNADGFETYSRRPTTWDDCGIASMPALYIAQTDEEVSYSGDNTALPLHIMDFPIAIYFNAADPTTVPDTVLNTLLDAVDVVLTAPPYDPSNSPLNPILQTNNNLLLQNNLLENPNLLLIAGTVCYSRIEGAITRIPGYLDGQGGAFFTIRVLVPS